MQRLRRLSGLKRREGQRGAAVGAVAAPEAGESAAAAAAAGTCGAAQGTWPDGQQNAAGEPQRGPRGRRAAAAGRRHLHPRRALLLRRCLLRRREGPAAKVQHHAPLRRWRPLRRPTCLIEPAARPPLGGDLRRPCLRTGAGEAGRAMQMALRARCGGSARKHGRGRAGASRPAAAARPRRSPAPARRGSGRSVELILDERQPHLMTRGDARIRARRELEEVACGSWALGRKSGLAGGACFGRRAARLRVPERRAHRHFQQQRGAARPTPRGRKHFACPPSAAPMQGPQHHCAKAPIAAAPGSGLDNPLAGLAGRDPAGVTCARGRVP